MIQVITQQIIDQTKELALNSSRKRAMYKFHQPFDRMQRMINVLVKGTYIQPHQHNSPPKTEQFIVLLGEVVCLTFQENGQIESLKKLTAGGPIYGVTINPGTIHTLICLSDTATISETIDGVFDPATHKQYVDFAPQENSPKAKEYLQSLEKLIMKESSIHV